MVQTLMLSKKKNQEFSFKLKAGVFLASVGGVSAVVGFGTALAAARRREAQGSAHGAARAALATAAPADGALLALRALAWGTAYAVGGVGLLCFGVWKLSGANDPLSDIDSRTCPPLIVAALNDSEKVVSTILKSDPKPDLEVDATLHFKGHNDIEGVTALWCAAGTGHFEIVKSLVDAGADVNHATKTNSTPIHVACYAGKLNIVKFLREHGADIEILENHGHTCLMAATYGGHMDVLLFLLDQGADCHRKTPCGNTALHIAAEYGNVHILVLLMKFGAVPTKNKNGLSPLLGTARSTFAFFLEYLVTLPEFSKEDKILALELLGAAFASDMYFYDLPSAYKYMRLSMELRFSDPEAPLPKVLGEPVAAYGNWVECQSLEELERIQHDAAALHMESLAVRERILGQRHPEVADAVEFRGTMFAEDGRYDRSAELWLHALRMRQRNKLSVSDDLTRFAKICLDVKDCFIEM